jgi:hypothetical protein
MKNAPRYKIVFTGQLLPGFDMMPVKASLASMFGISTSLADKMFLGRAVLVKTESSLEAARLFKQEMERSGCRCRLEELVSTGGG